MDSDRILVDLKTYFGISAENNIPPEQSKVAYLPIVDKQADTLEAVADVAAKLYQELEIGNKLNHVVVAGDQKTYTRLWELKHTYGADLDWLIPFICDWHLLKNYQSDLMKVYYAAGLKDLVESAGFRGETLTSSSKCSNCRHAHRFILQTWEAFYRHMYSCFISQQSNTSEEHTADILAPVRAMLQECVDECKYNRSYQPFLEYLCSLGSQEHSNSKDFLTYVSMKAEIDSNWKFNATMF